MGSENTPPYLNHRAIPADAQVQAGFSPGLNGFEAVKVAETATIFFSTA